ncbi:hypothetical protein D0894_17385 [Pseudomonas monteilii]|uniref:Uncharacterized protein n=1 Tax=Pseudomonas monteilii TaxID=76759 RepID=A0A399M3J1_9PSED|nr:hypothetical protein D0894_17385 [Pseudomonas monteilii]
MAALYSVFIKALDLFRDAERRRFRGAELRLCKTLPEACVVVHRMMLTRFELRSAFARQG